MLSFIRHVAIALAVLPLAEGRADEYRDAKPAKPIFDYDQLGLMAIEREKVASELAAYVCNELGRGARLEEADNSGRLNLASRMLGVALQLHPRNRTALIANFKFGHELTTEFVSADYEPGVLAEYLYTRSKLLVEQGGAPNGVLAAYLLAFSVEIDPTNEDAIYDNEILSIDGKAADWNLLFPGSIPRSSPVTGVVAGDKPKGGEGAGSAAAPFVTPPRKETAKPSFKGWPLGNNGLGGGPLVTD